MEKKSAAMLTDTIKKVKDMIDVSTIIGDPVYTESGLTIIPVSKVTYGLASGGSDFPTESGKETFGGCGGAGVTITPVAFLLIKDGEVTLKNISAFDASDASGLLPDVLGKVSGLLGK